MRYAKGNLLDVDVEAFVNTVNTVGVMGKGVALMFKEKFPENFAAYEKACRAGEVRIGKMFVTKTHELGNPRYIINFPTKRHWRHPSRLEYVREGLQDLVRVVRKLGIQSIALPPLGCGNGGLKWADVRREIARALDAVPQVKSIVFSPTAAYQNVPKKEGVKRLTPARALLLGAIQHYAALGFECTNLEVQKLGYLIQRVVEGLALKNPLRLKFVAEQFGPYAENLKHLLDALDGSFLHCTKRLADAGPTEPIALDLDRLRELEGFWKQNDVAKYRQVLDQTSRLIQGFETPFLMELLTTVDWIARKHGDLPSVSTVRNELAKWPGGKYSSQRKSTLFKEREVRLALDRLKDFRGVLLTKAA